MSDVLTFIAIAMVVIFFVTSCDSGAMVVDMLCSYGNNNTPVWQRIYWAVGVGVVAAVLLGAGGLEALQTMTIASALPFAIILLLSLVGLVKALRIEDFKHESLQNNAIPSQPESQSEGWRERLQNIVNFPNKKTVEAFIDKTVSPAFESVSKELQTNQIEVVIMRKERAIEIHIKHGEEQEFVYGVHRIKHLQPDFASTDIELNESDDEQIYYRAEVHLSEGGQNYDVMGWSKLAVINDVIDQYHKHLHFLHLMR
jgi:choline/glycine/proline betaine transport protein